VKEEISILIFPVSTFIKGVMTARSYSRNMQPWTNWSKLVMRLILRHIFVKSRYSFKLIPTASCFQLFSLLAAEEISQTN